jgi:glycosyltransferase involved in cell wall biosynthesis
MTYPFRRAEPRPPVVLVPAVHTTNDWGFVRPHLIDLAARAFATVAHTEHEREWLITHGAPAERVRVIGHGIELRDFRPVPGRFRVAHSIPSDALVVAYVGQQGGHKGIDTLLRVLPRVLERRPDAWLVVAGARTPYSDELRRIVGGLPDQARSRALILDDVTSAERAEVLADCDIFASPSEQEAFGITTLEAWSQAKPVVVGDGPAQACVVEHGVSGLLVPYGDEHRLFQTLAELADDEALRRRLGEAGERRLHERHVHSDIAAQYHALFVAAARRDGA